MAETPDGGPSHSHRKKKRRTIDVLVDFVPSQEGFSLPFVGYFPSGFDPEQLPAATGAQSNGNHQQGSLIASAFQNTDRYKTRQHQLIVTPPTGAVDFVGTNYLGEGAMRQPGNYALGLFDKENKTLKLLPLCGAKVLRLEPRVRGLDYGEVLSEAADIEPSSKEVMLQRRNLLTSTFGTHRSRVRLNRFERGRVKEETLGDKQEIGRLFEKAATNLSVLTSDEALQQANAAVTRQIPPHDPSATTPQKAYIFDDIITPEEQNSLSDIIELKTATVKSDQGLELRESNIYPDFVLKRLHKLTIENDEEGNSKRAIILSYLRHLLTFNCLPRHLIRSIVDPVGYQGVHSSSRAIDLSSHSNIPSAVASKFLKLFTTVSQEEGNEEIRIQTSDNRNLLISYILVLGLMVDNFKADPYDLAVELKMSISQLKPHYMELGCKLKLVTEKDRAGFMDPNSSQKMYEVVLPVPLQFPKMKVKTRRRR